MKSVKELSWDVSEEEYRRDPAISYSTLSTFQRDVPGVLLKLHEKKDSDALRFGSLVDCLITEPETLDSRFIVADLPPITDTMINIAKKIASKVEFKVPKLDDVSNEIILEVAQQENYYNNRNSESRIGYIRKDCTRYYELLIIAQNLTLVSSTDFLYANKCVEELKSNEFLKGIFTPGALFEKGIERMYQLKFKIEEESLLPIRCMFDLTIVDHINKTIRPIDLKTTGKDEHKFEDSFLTWNYYLQATFYTHILKKVIEQDEYFSSFTILPYYFIVINRYSLTPLIWEFKHNHHQGDFVTNNGEVLKGWKSLLTEVTWHYTNDKFKYSKLAYLQNGILLINNLTPQPSNNNKLQVKWDII